MENWWETVFQLLFAFGTLSIIIERSLYQIFNTKTWERIEKHIDERYGEDIIDLKPFVSIIICISVVFRMDLDMIAQLFNKDCNTSTLILTGLFLSGGSTTVYETLKRYKEMRDMKMESAKNTLTNGGK